MSSAQFKLDMFEGPLDLLLHLISKHKLNIHDIEISLLLEQYLEYMHQLDHEDLEDAADFLEMAARLIYIKTVSLLPQDEEAVELKKELEGRLIEYSQCKLLANELGKVYAGGNIFVRKPVAIPVDKTYAREHDPQVLLEAYLGLSEKARNEKPINAKIFQPIVSYKVVSVGSKIVYILKKLYTVGVCDLSHIYDDMETKSERVAAFLAVLELTKSGRICLNDDNTQIFFSEKSRKRKKHHDTAPNVPSDDELPGEAAQEELSPVQQEGNAPLSQQKPLESRMHRRLYSRPTLLMNRIRQKPCRKKCLQRTMILRVTTRKIMPLSCLCRRKWRKTAHLRRIFLPLYLTMLYICRLTPLKGISLRRRTDRFGSVCVKAVR